LFLAACGKAGGKAKSDAQAAADTSKTEASNTVVLDTIAMRLGGIVVGRAESVPVGQLLVTGTITYDPSRVSEIGARAPGRVTAMRAELGDRVGQGQVLAVLESPDIGQLRATQRQGVELLAIARENFAREKGLAEQGISSRKELLVAEADLRRAEAEVRSTAERLRVLGASAGTGSQFVVTSPFAGVVVARKASLGEMAEPADSLFTIADLSRVWIELDVFERDLARVRVGQSVSVSVVAYPDRLFPGRIVYVGDVLDPKQRTVRARVEIPNANRALKPGMFARAGIGVATGGVGIVVVPQSAVQEFKGRHVVFIPGTRAGEFRAVVVEPGESLDGNRITIRSGLVAGSPIVIAGAFALRSELGKGEIGDEK
jgi:cobalt-zinc-cadmium efflux system membrane fusion protein